jgi:hypothetical protein
MPKAKTFIEKMEEAAGISVPAAEAKPATTRERTYQGQDKPETVTKPQPSPRPRTYQGPGGDVNVNK